MQPTESNISRRGLLVGGALATAGLVVIPVAKRLLRGRAAVFVARNQRYDESLVTTICDGLLATGLQSAELRGKRVLLKPNLVEPYKKSPHLTTNPLVVAAAAEVFLKWGANVTVGEGPGHVRDTEMALVEGRMQEVLDNLRLPFADLNYEDVAWTKNGGRTSRLDGFYFPRTVVEADLIVSMAKLKTHHWVGVTASMKNLYGVIPGIKYGWPKNVLHHMGIPQTVFDINASLPKTIAIVDGIECMEGDGPIMGTPKHLGVLVMGTNPTAVDATVCQLMKVDPKRIDYLRLAADRLGPIDDGLIDQRGERWQPLASEFKVLDVPHLRHLRTA
jgi:uncharacterized protein (DUF362 family)